MGTYSRVFFHFFAGKSANFEENLRKIREFLLKLNELLARGANETVLFIFELFEGKSISIRGCEKSAAPNLKYANKLASLSPIISTFHVGIFRP